MHKHLFNNGSGEFYYNIKKQKLKTTTLHPSYKTNKQMVCSNNDIGKFPEHIFLIYVC